MKFLEDNIIITLPALICLFIAYFVFDVVKTLKIARSSDISKDTLNVLRISLLVTLIAVIVVMVAVTIARVNGNIDSLTYSIVLFALTPFMKSHTESIEAILDAKKETTYKS